MKQFFDAEIRSNEKKPKKNRKNEQEKRRARRFYRAHKRKFKTLNNSSIATVAKTQHLHF